MIDYIIEALKIIVPAVVIIIGWFIANDLASKRDIEAKRVELRFKYLLEAHRAISSGACRTKNFSNDQKLAFESAIEDIQLLGNSMQLDELKKILATKNNDFMPLILALRHELRSSMKLDENKLAQFYRFGD